MEDWCEYQNNKKELVFSFWYLPPILSWILTNPTTLVDWLIGI